VIALWEVDEVARTRSLPHAARAHQTQPIISETCPPGEGDLCRVNADGATRPRSAYPITRRPEGNPSPVRM